MFAHKLFGVVSVASLSLLAAACGGSDGASAPNNSSSDGGGNGAAGSTSAGGGSSSGTSGGPKVCHIVADEYIFYDRNMEKQTDSRFQSDCVVGDSCECRYTLDELEECDALKADYGIDFCSKEKVYCSVNDDGSITNLCGLNITTPYVRPPDSCLNTLWDSYWTIPGAEEAKPRKGWFDLNGQFLWAGTINVTENGIEAQGQLKYVDVLGGGAGILERDETGRCIHFIGYSYEPGDPTPQGPYEMWWDHYYGD